MSALTLHSLPEQLPRVTRFSDEQEMASPFTVVAMVKGMPALNRDLKAATSRVYRWGSDPMPGDWHLVYLAFVSSRIPDIQPWYQRVRTDSALWRICGFKAIPGYATVHKHFTRRVEPAAAAFEAAASNLIQLARQHDPRVGAWWHIDASEAETHAAPQHDCQLVDPCPTRGGRTPHLTRPDTAVIRQIRQGLADQPEDAPAAPLSREGLTTEAITKVVIEKGERQGKRFLSGGHWWFSRDAEAGTRAYSRNGRMTKAWHGYLHVEVVDHFTGGSLASFLIPANQQESQAYPESYERAFRNCGDNDPLIVAGDRGYSFTDNFEYNSNRGVATVFPFRRRNHEAGRAGNQLFDEHGIPRCRHCAGETRQIRFAVDRGRGRLWFKCKVPRKPGCRSTQTIFCDRDARYLVPLWRTEPAYAAMRVSHQSYESKHRALRIQYLVAPDSLAIRPKRIGKAWQQVRASAAMVIDWLRIFQLSGWRNGTATVAVAPQSPKANQMVLNLATYRAAKQAAVAIGAALAALFTPNPGAPPPTTA
jgi:hypothetical protein